MNDKYTCEYDKIGKLWHIIENDLEGCSYDFSFSTFESQTKAELVCRLLNENEARKNHNKIDKEVIYNKEWFERKGGK